MDLHYVCLGCSRPTDADARPSPRELEHVCADCADIALGLQDWGGAN